MAEDSSSRRRTLVGRGLSACLLGGLLLLGAWAIWFSPDVPDAALAASKDPPAPTPSETGATIRIAGTVEAVRAFSVRAPRLMGQSSGSPLVITTLMPGGTQVEAGDLLVEFDRQDQERTARDQRSEFLDLEGQIRQLQAEHAAARATDQAELTVATSDVARARLEVTTNPLLPRVDAEKNDLVLEEKNARLVQLGETLVLNRTAAAAELRILEIRRDRALRDARSAEGNAARMVVRAPFGGLVVLKTVYRGGGRMVDMQESEEVRPGTAILDVVDVSGMQVRAKVNQADIAHVSVGRAAQVRLDAYPDLVFDGRVVQVAPLAVRSALSPRVRTFAAIVAIDGAHELLMPDLSAAIEIQAVQPSARERGRSTPGGDVPRTGVD